MYVGASGPKTAKIAIVGEKGGEDELRNLIQTGNGIPFIGQSGKQLDELLVKIGINRNQVYVTNAVKNIEKVSNPTRSEIEGEQFALFRELLSLPNLNVIVPMGNCALQSLSNFHLGISKENSGREVGTGMKKYRGSILPSFIHKKMVPTFHPSYYMHGEWRYKPVVTHDLRRALEESYDPRINVPSRRCYIAQSRDDLNAIGHHFHEATYISFDIELLRGRFIQCIAFSKDPNEAYCIPFTNGYRRSLFSAEDELFAWGIVQQILNQEKSCYVTQNGLFDCWHLWRHGIVTSFMSNGLDTMLMHRYRAPDLPHDLGFLVSIYTREPYYKDESGDWKLQIRTTSDEQFWAYNCKDASCTLEVCFALIDDLKRHNMFMSFRRDVQRQWSVITQMRQRGLKIDVNALQSARQIIADDIKKDEAKILSTLGWSPNTQSSLDMGKLYAQLGIRLSSADLTKTGLPKRDIERLYSHAYNQPQHRDLLYTIASLNQKRTLESGFTNFPMDRDGFYHPSLDIHKTKTGRLASEGAEEGGPQIQNIPKRIRSVVISDSPETDELTNADLAGAETWLQAHYAKDPLLIEALTKRIKVHKVRGCVIYRDWDKDYLPPKELLDSILLVCSDCAKIGELECNHSEYYMSKQSGHAMGYREGPVRFCREQRKRGIFIAESVAKELRAKIISKYLAEWHLTTELNIRRTAWVETVLDLKREFYGRIDDSMVNAILSWLCQAVVGRITNRAMMYLHDEYLKLSSPQPRILTQTHDSILTSHHRSLRPIVNDLYHAAFHQPLSINGRDFLIPIEITHGKNWRDLK